jgi:hypothetical protein
VSKTAKEYLVEVDLPGVAREDVAVDLAGNELVIDGEINDREHEGVFRQRARRAGRFSFRALLPQDVDADHIEANLADGVLSVRAPKTEKAKARRIAISSDRACVTAAGVSGLSSRRPLASARDAGQFTDSETESRTPQGHLPGCLCALSP